MRTKLELASIRRKLRILECEKFGKNVAKKCRFYGISRQIYYRWRSSYSKYGEQGLISSRPCPQNHKLRTPKEIEDKIIYVRSTYHMGCKRISWYLARYLDMKISPHGVECVLKRHGMNRLPSNSKVRSPGPHYKLYAKQVPGHHIQMDVKFLNFEENEHKIKRYQYTAIDDATRVRILKVYEKHNQDSSIDFFNHIKKEFPFRIKMIRTDNGHEFQTRFHWHLMDEGIEHAYIKKATPRLNGKVERSHRIDKTEFYQAIQYKGDQDLEAKLKAWQDFYNFHRPHGAHDGKTPYEILHEKLSV